MPGSSNRGPGAVPNTTGLPTVRSFAPQIPIGETGNSSIIVQADVGSLDMTGFAPTIVNNVAVPVGLGALTLTGFAPVIAGAILPGVGSVTLSGLAPVLASSIATGVGALSLAGLAPVIAGKINADVGVLSLAGLAPVIVQTQNVTLLPDVGVLTIDGFAPDLSGIEITTQGVGADFFVRGRPRRKKITRERVFEGFAPTVVISERFVPKIGPVIPAPVISPIVVPESAKLDQVSSVVPKDIPLPVSSKGRTAGFEPANRGSNPRAGITAISSVLAGPQPTPVGAQASPPASITEVLATSAPPAEPILCESQTGELLLEGWQPSVMVTDGWRPQPFDPPTQWTPEQDDDIAIIAALYSLAVA